MIRSEGGMMSSPSLREWSCLQARSRVLQSDNDDDRRRLLTPATVTSLAPPSLCVGRPVMNSLTLFNKYTCHSIYLTYKYRFHTYFSGQPGLDSYTLDSISTPVPKEKLWDNYLPHQRWWEVMVSPALVCK